MNDYAHVAMRRNGLMPATAARYTASANLCPAHLRPVVGWIIGWLSVLAQLVGLSSSEYGLANMIWSAVVIAKVCT